MPSLPAIWLYITREVANYRRLRTKTKQRMLNKLALPEGLDFARMQSYLGVLSHANAGHLAQQVRAMYTEVIKNKP